MKFKTPLLPGILQKRYKRFLADVTLSCGKQVTAHCANPGAMTGLNRPGMRVWLSQNDDPRRKLKYSWELVEVDQGAGPTLAGINTAHPNRLVEEAIREGVIAELSGYDSLARERKYGRNSRIDLLLESKDRPSCYVEVKNVHLMRRPGLAEFPDSVTARGAKHLAELAEMAGQGHRAVMVYLVQRADATAFTLAQDIDPAYAAAFRAALSKGVEAIAYGCRLSEKEITVTEAIPVLNPDTHAPI